MKRISRQALFSSAAAVLSFALAADRIAQQSLWAIMWVTVCALHVLVFRDELLRVSDKQSVSPRP